MEQGEKLLPRGQVTGMTGFYEVRAAHWAYGSQSKPVSAGQEPRRRVWGSGGCVQERSEPLAPLQQEREGPVGLADTQQQPPARSITRPGTVMSWNLMVLSRLVTQEPPSNKPFTAV